MILFLRGIALLPSVIQGIESLFGAKTGEQKKEAALSIVTSAINITNAVEQKTIVDPASFTSALGCIVDGIVACLNASIWHKGTSTPVSVASTTAASTSTATTAA
ncbi:MAG TPA: hypothetical protein VM865_00830 [Acidobacteriaceae bacterium]|nr:hypothetical protein [Acidobacteriaceae bacterium]